MAMIGSIVWVVGQNDRGVKNYLLGGGGGNAGEFAAFVSVF
jgi:hypothetical protein